MESKCPDAPNRPWSLKTIGIGSGPDPSIIGYGPYLAGFSHRFPKLGESPSPHRMGNVRCFFGSFITAVLHDAWMTH